MWVTELYLFLYTGEIKTMIETMISMILPVYKEILNKNKIKCSAF